MENKVPSIQTRSYSVEMPLAKSALHQRPALIVSCVLVIAALGIGAYFLFFSGGSTYPREIELNGRQYVSGDTSRTVSQVPGVAIHEREGRPFAVVTHVGSPGWDVYAVSGPGTPTVLYLTVQPGEYLPYALQGGP
jgi:hypothetical protein